MSQLDLTFVDQCVARLGRGQEAVIPILQAIQTHYRYVPDEAIERVCRLTDITPAAIVGVSTFYNQFRHRPVGRHIIHVCHGTACHVKGAEVIQDAFQRRLKIGSGGDTDPDGLFTIEKVACLGCCTLAPVVQIDGVTYGRLAPTIVGEVIEDFLRQQKSGTAKRPAAPIVLGKDVGEIRVGLGSCCVAQGSGRVYRAIEEALAESGAPAVVKRVGCVGMCHQTPLLEITAPSNCGAAVPAARAGETPATPPGAGETPAPQRRLFAKVNADDAAEIVLAHFKPRGALRRIGRTVSRWLDRLLTDEAGDPLARHAIDARDGPVCAFLGPQQHLATEHCGQLDPLDLDEYLRHDGFVTLRRCLEQFTPPQIIEHVQASGLRGRGGAGFPTGLKWARVRAAKGDVKYIVCNGDEGDPGAFMDRMLLESFPYRIIEGVSIAARAVGAREGIFYIRAEYPLAVERIRTALERCHERGLLGKAIMGGDFDLELSVKEGAGAFVCGEETALLASIEGRRGMPRLRPPFPADTGLWNKPTLVNNVETFAITPWILRHGPEAFSHIGTPRSPGTKVFALAGKVRRGGLIEVPMGITLRQIVEEIGGGVADAACTGVARRRYKSRPLSLWERVRVRASAEKASRPHPRPLSQRERGDVRYLKAVQIGGPSGGCVPAELADTTVDYDALAHVGAIMGSGGLVVLDDADCMVDIARYFLRFTQDQSCGKCTLCRVGTRRMLDVLDRICEGRGQPGDLDDLERLALTVQAGSICGLGRTAPNPVLSTLRYFRHEYEAHIAGRCPAGRCKSLVHYRVTDDCIGCTLCAQQCPADAIPLTPYAVHNIDQEKCTRCDICRQICPEGAIVVE
ncbi:MAG: NAD(P)H-dependent oxidoreductase subunit E [Thermoguttaceae bacterium]